MKKINVLGIMSGTSLDGVDFVLCQIQQKPFEIKFLDQFHSPFPKNLRQRLIQTAQHKNNVQGLAILHHDLGRFYAKEVSKHKTRHHLRIDLIGLHGQTVFHQPPLATLQIGEPSYLSAAVHVPVINDFRVADLALRGQGAPLATVFHAALFEPEIRKNAIAVHNLGGISNVSFFEKGAIHNGSEVSRKTILSFDTGPGNMLIDLGMKKWAKKSYDQDGKLSASGLPKISLVTDWLKHPYFKKSPPKSCGREEFGEIFFSKTIRDMKSLSVLDKMATLTEFTAQSIAKSYHDHLPDLPAKTYLCGGGARNAYLKFRIQYHLPEIQVFTSEDTGWPVDSIEGAAFALMAAMKLWNKPAHLPRTTGAVRQAHLGKVVQV